MSGFQKNVNEPSLLIHQFFRWRIYSTFNRAGGFYHRYSRPDIDRPLNKEKREITADLSLPPCQPLNHPPSGEKPEWNMTTADSLSVSPLWLHEVHIEKTPQVAQWEALCVNGCRQTRWKLILCSSDLEEMSWNSAAEKACAFLLERHI